jgi:hypothetical protein
MIVEEERQAYITNPSPSKAKSGSTKSYVYNRKIKDW